MKKSINLLSLVFVLLIYNYQLEAKTNKYFYKGEVKVSLTSPLYMFQKTDSTHFKRYFDSKNLYNKSKYSKSLDIALPLLLEVEKSNNKELEALCNLLLGDLFRKINNQQKKAIFHYKKSLNLIRFIDNPLDSKIVVYDKDYLNNNSIQAANLIKIGASFLRLNAKDSAKFYLKKVLNINSLNNDLLHFKASANNNLSAINIQEENYSLAKMFALKSVEIRRKLNDKLNEAAALGNLASIHVIEKDFTKAKNIYKKALDLIDNDKSNTALKFREDLYYNLAWALYNLKDFTAYDYQEKSYLIKDSLRDIEIEHVVQGVYEKFQIDLKKEQVNLVNNQVALKEAEEKRTAWFFGILSFLIIISSGVILYNYKLRQKNLKLQLDQTQLAQKNKLEKLKSESQVRILNATLDGKETERKQIAETLHDSVSSLLSSANLHLQASKMQFKGEAPVEIDKTQKIIVEASQTIRDLSHTLVSSVLLKFGLKYAIKDMADKYSNSKIEINTNIKNVKRYQQSFEIKANNIIQELVNNILKHSNATKASVKMEDKNGILFVDIQDDGDGFDKKEITKKDGLGINQIEARIQMMKGKFHIDSNTETGTKIKIELPIIELKTNLA